MARSLVDTLRVIQEVTTMPEISTLIIANNLRTADYVKQWISNHAGRTEYDSIGSCPPIERLARDTMATTSSHTALRDLQGWRPARIIIVNYPDWRTRAGEMSDLWRRITLCRDFNDTEVVWW